MVYLILAFVSSGVCDGWGCSSAGRAPALQAGGQRFDPAQLHQFTLVSMLLVSSRADNVSFEEIKVCITSMKCCLFCKNREEKIDLEASRYGFRPMSEAGSNDVVDGLAGRMRKRDRKR